MYHYIVINWSICRISLPPLYCNATSHAVEQAISCPWCWVPATATNSPFTLTPEEQQKSDSKKFSVERVMWDRIQIRGMLLLLIFVLGEEWRRMDKNAHGFGFLALRDLLRIIAIQLCLCLVFWVFMVTLSLRWIDWRFISLQSLIQQMNCKFSNSVCLRIVKSYVELKMCFG